MAHTLNDFSAGPWCAEYKVLAKAAPQKLNWTVLKFTTQIIQKVDLLSLILGWCGSKRVQRP